MLSPGTGRIVHRFTSQPVELHRVPLRREMIRKFKHWLNNHMLRAKDTLTIAGDPGLLFIVRFRMLSRLKRVPIVLLLAFRKVFPSVSDAGDSLPHTIVINSLLKSAD